MTGIYEEGSEPAPRTGQPAAVLSSWIEEQLRDIQGAQVTRFVHLRGRLQSEAFEWDDALLARAIEVLRDEAARLDFEPLHKRGLLSMLRGSGGRESFVAQHDRIVAAARDVQACAADLAKTYKAHTSGARRVLVELEMEQQAMARDVVQAVEWLGEMSEDVARQLHARGEGAALTLLMKRAEFYAGHLKALHGIQDMAAAVCVMGQNVLERRNALLEQLKTDLEGFEKVWMRKVGSVAEHAGDGAIPGLDKGEAAHAELLARLEQTLASSETLQLEEHSIGLRLAALRKELEELAS